MLQYRGLDCCLSCSTIIHAPRPGIASLSPWRPWPHWRPFSGWASSWPSVSLCCSARRSSCIGFVICGHAGGAAVDRSRSKGITEGSTAEAWTSQKYWWNFLGTLVGIFTRLLYQKSALSVNDLCYPVSHFTQMRRKLSKEAEIFGWSLPDQRTSWIIPVPGTVTGEVGVIWTKPDPIS